MLVFAKLEDACCFRLDEGKIGFQVWEVECRQLTQQKYVAPIGNYKSWWEGKRDEIHVIIAPSGTYSTPKLRLIRRLV